MVESRDHFAARLQALGHKHTGMRPARVTTIDCNGNIIAPPKRRRREFPLKLFLMFLLGFFGFKAFLLANVGPTTYNERLARMESGSVVERAGAHLLAIDPVTERIAVMTGPVLR